jgi:hypothetical protein
VLGRRYVCGDPEPGSVSWAGSWRRCS